MRVLRKLGFGAALSVSAALLVSPGLTAENDSISLKPGETADLGTLYWISNCRSELTTTPTAEVMDGPAELTVTVKAKSVIPRKQNCAKPVPGGELNVSASKDIKSRLQGKLFVRVNYATKDGSRQRSREIDYVVFPDAAGAAATNPAVTPPAKAP